MWNNTYTLNILHKEEDTIQDEIYQSKQSVENKRERERGRGDKAHGQVCKSEFDVDLYTGLFNNQTGLLQCKPLWSHCKNVYSLPNNTSRKHLNFSSQA